jgi:hypothetical protein
MTQEVSIEHKDALKVQLREAYGRIVYTYTSHNKLMGRINRRYKVIKIVQIVLSAVSTFGFIGSLIMNNVVATWIGGVFAVVLLGLNLFFKEFHLPEQAAQHRNASDDLWLIREQYITLLTDFPVLSETEIMAKRDELRDKTYEIYKQTPKTDPKSYKEAQNALKNKGEQSFTSEEIDNMLPGHLRENDNETSA